MKNKTITYSNSCYEKKNVQHISLEEALSIVKQDERIKEITERIRKAPNKQTRTKIKSSLPVVVFQGVFDILKKDGFVKHSQLAVIDIDVYDGIDKSIEIKNKIIQNDHVVFCFLSPSGGLKVGCKIPEVKNDHEYKEYYLGLIDLYEKYSIETDTKTKDICRLCFLSYDPEIYINYNAVDFDKKIEIKKTVKIDTDIKTIRTGSPQIREALTYIKPDDREVWIQVCCALKSEQEDYFDLFNSWSMKSDKYKGEEDCRRTWESFDQVDEGITIGTLFFIAKENGYIPKYKYKMDLVDMSVEHQAKEVIDKNPMYYDNTKKWWAFDLNKKYWRTLDEVDIIQFIKKAFCFSGLSTTKHRAEMLNALKDEARSRKPKELKDTQIQFGKYIYDISSDEIIKSTPEFKSNIYVDREIDKVDLKKESCPHIDKMFEDWLNEDKDILYQTVAFMLSPKYFIDVCFWLVGAGENGKGLFQQVILKTLGYENSTSQEIELLSDPKDRFTKVFLKDKLVCCLGDGNHSCLKETKGLKMLSGCADPIRGESKGSMVDQTFFNTAKLLGSYNTLPETLDKTNGFYRRQYIIEFKNTFTGMRNPLPDVPEREYDVLCAKCFYYLKKMYSMEEKTLIGWGSIEDRREKYEKLSDPIGLFLKNHMEEDYESVFFLKTFVLEYTKFAIKKGFNQFNLKEIEARLLNKGIEKKRHNVFCFNGFCWGKRKNIPIEILNDQDFTEEKEKYAVFHGYKFLNTEKKDKKDKKDRVFKLESLRKEASSKSASFSSFLSQNVTNVTNVTTFSDRKPYVKKQVEKHVTKVTNVTKDDLLSKIPEKPIDYMDFYERFAEKTMSHEEFQAWYEKNLERGEIYEPKPGFIARLK